MSEEQSVSAAPSRGRAARPPWTSEIRGVEHSHPTPRLQAGDIRLKLARMPACKCHRGSTSVPTWVLP